MFDYKKAWREEAAPRVLSLPTSSLQLIWRTHTEAKGLRQRRDLSVDWPTTDLRAAFVAMNDEELSYAAHVLACEGHWHPGYKDWLKPLTKQGTYWRFAAYADETLRANLGVRQLSRADGFTIEILEGKLRIGIGYEHKWYSTFVGLATEKNLEVVRANKVEANNQTFYHEDGSQKSPSEFLASIKEKVNDSRLIDTEKYTT